jgi:hypothetical protein
MGHFQHLCRVAALVLCSDRVFAQTFNGGDAEAHGQPWAVGQPVKTTSGTIIGHPASERAGVSEYLGIKYARNPVGRLRFAAPQPYLSNNIYNASAYVGLIFKLLESANSFIVTVR